MPRLSLSTSVLNLADTPGALLERWRSLTGAATESLSVDPRVPQGLQEELLREANQRGLRCTEVAHPLVGPEGRKGASFAGRDRHERRALVSQLRNTLERACDHEARRVVLYPTSLELSVPPSEVRRRYALGFPLRLEELAEERQAKSEIARDSLAIVLDAVLERASDLGLTILILTPPPLFNQFPGPGELAETLRLFTGAPLGWCHATDRAHVASSLELAAEEQSTPPASVRLADACGLSLRLPLDTGEIDWTQAPAFLRSVEELVLTLDVNTLEEEVASSIARASELWVEGPP